MLRELQARCASHLPRQRSLTSPASLLSPSQVPLHHVWLQGDNTRNSNDSRVYGPVACGLVRGRVVARVWPPSTAGRVSADPALGAVQLVVDGQGERNAALRAAREREAHSNGWR